MLGDVNGRIGELSVVLEDDEDEGKVVVVERESDDGTVNADGRMMLSLFSGLDVVVLNGVRGMGREVTCSKGLGSVVDWVAVQKWWMNEWDGVRVDDRGYG